LALNGRLGTGEWIWARGAYERDLRSGLLGARRAGVARDTGLSMRVATTPAVSSTDTFKLEDS
jgi:hypothetical protein